MINYSTCLRANPIKRDEPKKAYANAQYSEIMSLEKFSQHIADHGSVYSRADIQAVLTQAVDCMREMLLAGQRIRLGDLGIFYVRLKCIGAESLEKFTVASNITDVTVRWHPGERFTTLMPEAEFQQVPTRAASKAVTRALKAGDTVVDLTTGSSSGGSSGGGNDGGGDSGGGDSENPMG